MTKHYRLVNKRRFFMLLTLLFMLIYLAGTIVSASAVSDEPQATKAVKVQKGDTLWEIASLHCTGDIRENVFKIRQMNGISHGIIHEGQVLLLP